MCEVKTMTVAEFHEALKHQGGALMIDLMTFCEPNYNTTTDRPWSVGEWTFATNGHILVRVPRRREVTEHQNAPSVLGTSMEAIFDKEPDTWLTIPTVTVEQEECRRCNGKGKLYICPECDGEGDVTPYTEHNEYDEQTCRTCDGDGQLKKDDWLRILRWREDSDADCANCQGTGKVWNDKPVTLGGALFSARYLSLLAALPNAELGVFGPLDTARFRFDGGDGLLMPMTEAERRPWR